jgi:hypothetical protein
MAQSKHYKFSEAALYSLVGSQKPGNQWLTVFLPHLSPSPPLCHGFRFDQSTTVFLPHISSSPQLSSPYFFIPSTKPWL